MGQVPLQRLLISSRQVPRGHFSNSLPSPPSPLPANASSFSRTCSGPFFLALSLFSFLSCIECVPRVRKKKVVGACVRGQPEAAAAGLSPEWDASKYVCMTKQHL